MIISYFQRIAKILPKNLLYIIILWYIPCVDYIMRGIAYFMKKFNGEERKD